MKMLTRSFSLLLIVSIMLSMSVGATAVFTQAESRVISVPEKDIMQMPSGLTPWNGSDRTGPKGDGSESNPYQISNGAELAWFGKFVQYSDTRSKCAILVNDIDLNNKDWSGFRIGGISGYNYAGKFDGQGHTIYNLLVTKDNNRSGGLFGNVGLTGNGATIKNLNLVNAKAKWTYTGTDGTSTLGIVCGELRMDDSVVENVHVFNGEITAADNAGVKAVGGVIGRVTGGTVKNCTADATIKLDNIANANATYSSAYENLSGVGGVVGVVGTSSTVQTNISNCGFSGTINAPNSSRVGGVIGNLAKTSYYSVVDCYNTGSVTGYRQVGGVIGWVYDGTGATIAPKRIYNTGAVTAKTDTSSYAAGLANGVDFSLLSYPAYSTGDVSAPSGFNDTCALLYTTLSDASQKDSVYALYAEQGSKHPLSAAGTAVTAAKDVRAMSQAEFADGTAQISLSAGKDKNPWYAKAGLNESKPVFGHQVTKTYDLTDDKVELTLDEPGTIPVTVAPIGTGVTVTLDSDSQSITESGTYLLKANTTTPELRVSGHAKVSVNLGLKKEQNVITRLEASKIRVSYPETESRTVILAFYKDKVLQDVIYQQNVKPEIVEGTSYVSAVIDLTGKDVKGCTLKAFLWENNTLDAIQDVEYIGKYDGPAATLEEKEQALIAVAESYLQRGSRIQYDSEVFSDDGRMRYTLGENSPEDYTQQAVGFTDETAFLLDVYDKALGIEITDEINAGSDLEIMVSTPSGLVEEDLSVGDILCLDYASQKDQKMLYLGDGKLVYADGESYDIVSGKDKKEEEGAVKEATLDGIMGCQTVSVLRPFVLYEAAPLSQEVKNRIENMQGVLAEKLSSHSAGMTVHPGDEVTFTYRIENTNKEEVNLDITDVVPEYTTLVSGCDAVDGKDLSWNVSVPAGETELVSYTVKVSDDTSVCGNTIDGSKGIVGGLSVTCPDNAIELTMNEVDEDRLQMAIHALSDSEFEYTTLVKWIYQVAFSKNASLGTENPAELLEQIYAGATAGGGGNGGVTGEEIPETVAGLLNMVPPSMFGGRTVESTVESLFGETRATILNQEDFITGDILIAQKDIEDANSATMYIYNGSEFLELVSGKMNKNDASVLLEKVFSYDRFVVLRPSMVLNTLNHYKTGERESLTPAQEAIVTTAESYLLRGDRMQYDDSRLTSSGEYRWQIREKHPEEYTADEWGYTNCAAFTFDTYYHGLDFDIGFSKELWNTSGLATKTPSEMRVYSYAKNPAVGPADLTDAEKEVIKQQVLDALHPGDIVVVRRESGTGHAMLYVGNGTIIHSTGSSYNYSTSAETFEPTVRYQSVMNLFSTGSVGIFGHTTPSSSVNYFGIIRPLNVQDAIPQYTQNRVKNMSRIKAEKLSSHTSCMSVNPGDTISYTFAVYNANDEEVTLDVTDVVPANTTYLSGAEAVDGNKLSWKITVPAGEKVSVSYQVKVNADVTNGTYIGSENGLVGGVPVNCPKVLVARTLTKEEQTALIAKAKEMQGTSLTDIALINTLYQEVTGVEDLLPGSEYADIISGIFVTATEQSGFNKLNTEGTYAEMVIPSMYGGRKFYSPQWDYKRVRLPRTNQLIPGDILVSRTSTAGRLHLFNGETFLDLLNGLAEDTYQANKRLEWLLAYGRDFAILRPSLAIK